MGAVTSFFKKKPRAISTRLVDSGSTVFVNQRGSRPAGRVILQHTAGLLPLYLNTTPPVATSSPVPVATTPPVATSPPVATAPPRNTTRKSPRPTSTRNIIGTRYGRSTVRKMAERPISNDRTIRSSFSGLSNASSYGPPRPDGHENNATSVTSFGPPPRNVTRQRPSPVASSATSSTNRGSILRGSLGNSNGATRFNVKAAMVAQGRATAQRIANVRARASAPLYRPIPVETLPEINQRPPVLPQQEQPEERGRAVSSTTEYEVDPSIYGGGFKRRKTRKSKKRIVRPLKKSLSLSRSTR